MYNLSWGIRRVELTRPAIASRLTLVRATGDSHMGVFATYPKSAPAGHKLAHGEAHFLQGKVLPRSLKL